MICHKKVQSFSNDGFQVFLNPFKPPMISIFGISGSIILLGSHDDVFLFWWGFLGHVCVSFGCFLEGSAAPKTMGFGGLELDLLRRPPVGLGGAGPGGAGGVGGGGLGGIPEKAWRMEFSKQGTCNHQMFHRLKQ